MLMQQPIDACRAMQSITPSPKVYEPYRLAMFFILKNAHTLMDKNWLTASVCNQTVGIPQQQEVKLFGGARVSQECLQLIAQWQKNGTSAAQQQHSYASVTAVRETLSRIKSIFFYVTPREILPKRKVPFQKRLDFCQNLFSHIISLPLGFSSFCSMHKCHDDPEHWQSQTETLWRRGYFGFKAGHRYVVDVKDLKAAADQLRNWSQHVGAPLTPPALPDLVANRGKVSKEIGPENLVCDAHCKARIRYLYPIDMALLEDSRATVGQDILSCSAFDHRDPTMRAAAGCRLFVSRRYDFAYLAPAGLTESEDPFIDVLCIVFFAARTTCGSSTLALAGIWERIPWNETRILRPRKVVTFMRSPAHRITALHSKSQSHDIILFAETFSARNITGIPTRISSMFDWQRLFRIDPAHYLREQTWCMMATGLHRQIDFLGRLTASHFVEDALTALNILGIRWRDRNPSADCDMQTLIASRPAFELLRETNGAMEACASTSPTCRSELKRFADAAYPLDAYVWTTFSRN